ncbi:hypothetical protein BDC45DRAFT_522377, partial [Circinella umbellata]
MKNIPLFHPRYIACSYKNSSYFFDVVSSNSVFQSVLQEFVVYKASWKYYAQPIAVLYRDASI